MTYTAPCRYCGQIHTFECEDSLNDVQQSKKSTSFCDCEAGKQMRRMESSREKAMDNAEELLEDFEELKAVIQHAIGQMSDSGLVSITADSGSGYKATVKLTQKGTIKLTVKKEARWEMES